MGSLDFKEGLIESILYKHFVEGKGFDAVFKETGHPFKKIWDFVHLLNLEKSTYVRQDEEIVCRLYVDLEMSSRKVAEVIGKSQPYVTKILKEHNCTRSSEGLSKKPSPKATNEAIKNILDKYSKDPPNAVGLNSLDDRIVPGHFLYDVVYSKECMKALFGYHFGEGVKIKCICVNCGEEFDTYACHIKGRKNVFCKPSCNDEWMSKNQVGENNPNWKGKTFIMRCSFCGELILKEEWAIKDKQNIFCDKDCEGKFKKERYIGKNNPNWVDGNSYGQYCHKFNDDLKERVRWFFADDKGVRRCFLCGEPEDPNNPRLPVHHVDYDKSTCCNGKTPYLVPLCQSCHNKTSGKNVRERYEKEIKEKLIEQTGGKCFFTKEEFRLFAKNHPEYFCV